MSKDEKVPTQPNALDLSNAGRGVWLVKVPKYIAQKWEQAPSGMDVGKLRINKTLGQKAQVSLTLTPEVLALSVEDVVPANHILDVSVVTKQTLGVFSQKLATEPVDGGPGDDEQLSMEGCIVQKLECRPIADKTYMELKRESIRAAAVPQRRVQPIDKIVLNYKPVKDHACNVAYREKKKAEGKKSRADVDRVKNMLYAAFEIHQYYNIKDLVKLTNQPIGYLKEVLKEICEYNMKNPHKNTWELKKEYRHYFNEKTAAEKADEAGEDNTTNEPNDATINNDDSNDDDFESD